MDLALTVLFWGIFDSTLKEALHLQVTHTESQHWQFVQFGYDISTEGEQVGQPVQFCVQAVAVSLRRVRFLPGFLWFTACTKYLFEVTLWG